MSGDDIYLVIVLAAMVFTAVWVADLVARQPTAVQEWYRYLRDRK